MIHHIRLVFPAAVLAFFLLLACEESGSSSKGDDYKEIPVEEAEGITVDKEGNWILEKGYSLKEINKETFEVEPKGGGDGEKERTIVQCKCNGESTIMCMVTVRSSGSSAAIVCESADECNCTKNTFLAPPLPKDPEEPAPDDGGDGPKDENPDSLY